jgi:hypothetical protein
LYALAYAPLLRWGGGFAVLNWSGAFKAKGVVVARKSAAMAFGWPFVKTIATHSPRPVPPRKESGVVRPALSAAKRCSSMQLAAAAPTDSPASPATMSP